MKLHSKTTRYKKELLENVIPFWTNHSIDTKYGGYFSCLDRQGKVFDTDKFIWLQARQVWMFATLYNKVESKKEWLDIAIHGAEFLEKYGCDSHFDWYFSLDRKGKPLIQPYNIFSNTFAAMAFGQLHLTTKNEKYAEIALKTFQRILQRKENPKGQYNKAYPQTRPLKNFALPMILSNLCLEIEHLIEPNLVDDLIDTAIHEVMDVFYHSKWGLILENVTDQGEFSNSFEGRLLNPGHAIEAMWFMMDLGVRLHRKDLIEKAVDITMDTLNYGWDQKHGGIFYFMDIKGHPPQQLEWDQKLWWVHIETMISLLKGYQLLKNPKCAEWFLKIEDYTWKHFKDENHQEWFGYLNRKGDVLLNLKGGKWKGCFHVPRGLYQCWKTLERISED
ncbi:MAG: AGE family epimerase/isomerase [Flavobacteriaceae bacterium]|nr:AGE family epimerase/isomerase [Flavobacteriaceae bacterium]